MPFCAHHFNDVKVKKPQQASTSIKDINEHLISLQNDVIYGGGYGGNEQTGIVLYDGLPHHPSAFPIQRDDKNSTCFLSNQTAGIYNYNFRRSLKLVSYGCTSVNEFHNGIYWNENFNIQNGGYSADNDALYASTIIYKMYEDWFGIPAVQKEDGSPLPLTIVTHMPALDNAYTYENQIFLGDGDKLFYPLTSPGVVSFMIAYIFTGQHSNLNFNQPASFAISIAFGAMADQAVKFYITDQNDWKVGNEISKTGTPFYYMDEPSKDCNSRTPGDNCSIDHISQYKPTQDPRFSSGIYRRAFYLLATTPDWDVKKAFSIFVQANRFYWTSELDFTQGLCGLIKAAHDFHYDESAVIDAFQQVGVSPENC